MTTVLRIGIDAHMLGSRETGNETYIRGLLTGLTGCAGDECFFVYVEHPDALPFVVRDHPRIRVIPLASRSSIRRLGWELPRRAHLDRLDVLHVTYNAPLRLPRTCARVVTIHDLSFEHFPEFFAPHLRLLLKLSVPRSARAADAVLVDSEFVKRDLVATYRLAPDKIAVTHAAVEAEFRRVDEAAALDPIRAKYRTGARFILGVGNLQPRKNWLRLIEAFAQAKQEHRLPHTLVIVGPRAWQSEQVVAAAQGLDDAVVFTGYVPTSDLVLLYNAAEVFVYPSLYEGFGLPVLEAMACGTPVITSNVSALPEIAGDAALLVNPYATQDIAAALVRVVSDEAYRAELRARGLARAREFSWERTAAQTLPVYRKVAGGR